MTERTSILDPLLNGDEDDAELKRFGPLFGELLGRVPLTLATCDRELRYTWVHNPHPDFDPSKVRGRRDDELGDNAGIQRLAGLKRQVLLTGETRLCRSESSLS